MHRSVSECFYSVERQPRISTNIVLSKSFPLETDASARGIGVTLSQQQSDDQLHPVAHANKTLS